MKDCARWHCGICHNSGNNTFAFRPFLAQHLLLNRANLPVKATTNCGYQRWISLTRASIHAAATERTSHRLLPKGIKSNHSRPRSEGLSHCSIRHDDNPLPLIWLATDCHLQA